MTAAYSFIRRRGGSPGVEVWLWDGNYGRNLNVCEHAPRFLSLDLARAWARQHAFRSGIPFVEKPREKRKPQGPPPTPYDQGRRRVGYLDERAQDAFEGRPGHAAGLWVNSAEACEALTELRPDRARAHAQAALVRIRNARTCLGAWEKALKTTEPVRRLKVVPSRSEGGR